ncbi:MAG: hypothetical protein NTX36_00775, partial [Proteobacteria bacterium]|nr:hypothetical protein [Pseudomonadota bacterium]
MKTRVQSCSNSPFPGTPASGYPRSGTGTFHLSHLRRERLGGQAHFTLYVIAALFLILPMICQGAAFAQAKPEQKKPEAKKTEPAPPQFNVGDFTYTSSNRRDPFEPIFLT